MKKILKITALLLLTLNFGILTIKAQTPNQFKYQAVLRDASGTILANEAVTVNISILQGSVTGVSVFDETHNVTTTAQGLINLNIGSINNLNLIDWSANTYFIEISVNGTIMGTSQLLSVPYALNAKNAENVFSGDYADLLGSPTNISFFTNDIGYITTQTDNQDLLNVLNQNANAGNIAIDNIKIGQTSTCDVTTEGNQRYNSVTKNMEFCNGIEWLPFNTGTACTPQPTTSNAGTDQIYLSNTFTTAILNANVPTEGIGEWTITSGAGGSFVNSSIATTNFNGMSGESYILTWTISNSCYNSSDNVNISFAGKNTVVFTMTSSDYQIIVDSVQIVYPDLVDAYGNGEFYTGATSYYSNFDLRISKRVDQPDFDGLSNDEAMALIDERVGEGIIMLLNKKFPDAVAQANGNDIFYIVNYKYFGNDYVSGMASKKFQCITSSPNPVFIYVE